MTVEIVPKFGDTYIALRRPQGIPGHIMTDRERKSDKGLLYFCHDLIRYGESTEDCVERIVTSQAGVRVTDYRVVDLESFTKKEEWSLDSEQWAIIPLVIAEIDSVPHVSQEVIEVESFDRSSVPSDFAWWTKDEVEEFIDDHDLD